MTVGGPIITRQIAILIDGGFLLRRLETLGYIQRNQGVEQVVTLVRRLARRHVQMLTRENDRSWQRHIYRIFFYDAAPFAGVAHHPLLNRQILYANSDVARFRTELFDRLRQERNVALRLGEVIRHDDWIMPTAKLKPLLPTRDWLANIDLDAVGEDGVVQLTPEQLDQARRLKRKWTELGNSDVALDLRQKGVDMRIGLDIAALALKRFVSTVVLISGDGDFVPAAKLARREGVQFILDALWQPRKLDQLFEHIDGLQSGLPNPNPAERDPRRRRLLQGNPA
jgi:uncharacterized LabA/DUF88 family protein